MKFVLDIDNVHKKRLKEVIMHIYLDYIQKNPYLCSRKQKRGPMNKINIKNINFNCTLTQLPRGRHFIVHVHWFSGFV